MNTPVSFEIKQLLYDNGWRYELGVDETGYRVEHSLAEQRWNEGDLTYIDITIAEVVMWLYEKHGIWIACETSKLGKFNYRLSKKESSKLITLPFTFEIVNAGYDYNSPTEAYEAAIKYCLEKII